MHQIWPMRHWDMVLDRQMDGWTTAKLYPLSRYNNLISWYIEFRACIKHTPLVSKTRGFRTLRKTHPSSRQYLCVKASRSAARPLPSQTTTGTGGVSVTYSSTDLIVLAPPSSTTHMTGTPRPFTPLAVRQKLRENLKSYRAETYRQDIGNWLVFKDLITS